MTRVPPRLAIVAPSAFLFGGVQSWLDYLVPGLEAKGWAVTVLLVHGRHGDADAYLRQHPFRNARKVENPTGSREGRIASLERAIAAVDSQLVLVVNIVDAYEAVARLRRGGAATRVAMALHGLHACFHTDLARHRELVDGVVATNRLAVAACEQLPPGRVHYAPCGVPIDAPPAPIADGAAFELRFAGRFDESEKRVLDLAPILEQLQARGFGFELRLAGSGPEETALRAALARFGERVHFDGVLDEETLRSRFFRPGTIALVLSPVETGPLVAWEAMASGAALVSSRFLGSGLEGALRDGATCQLFDVGDAVGAAGAIAALADPSRRAALADAGHVLVRERYSREASVEAWAAALESVLAAPPRPSPAPVAAPNEGRLDRFLGPAVAERLRRVLGRSYDHSGSGGEWPHSYGPTRDEAFERYLLELDRMPELGTMAQ